MSCDSSAVSHTMAATTPSAKHHAIPQWLEDNKLNFKPPVCNYMMHGAGRLKVMFVGGPNIRKDFHLEEGEEFFYMVKGSMVLIVVEHGNFRDIHIKEGEVFHLPGCILHSPQRYPDTMGLVIERERMATEMDCVRYFVGSTTETLYEEWFYCADLVTQLGPVIRRYFASKQHSTGLPIPETITETPPIVPDVSRTLEKPFNLMGWVEEHKEEIESSGQLRLFDTSYQSDIVALGAGTDEDVNKKDDETWLWQLKGTSTITTKDTTTELSPQGTLLIEAHSTYSHVRQPGSVCLSVVMSWDTKERALQHRQEKQSKAGEAA